MDFQSALLLVTVDTSSPRVVATFRDTITIELAVQTLRYILTGSVNNKPPRIPNLLRVVFYANARAQIIV